MRLALLFSLLLTACSPEDFPTETLVDRLRMLGLTSTPADLAPGETARLQSLVVDPTRAGQPTTTFWIGCDPDPFNLNRSACADPAVVNNPAMRLFSLLDARMGGCKKSR
jgi:hypothetical protein